MASPRLFLFCICFGDCTPRLAESQKMAVVGSPIGVLQLSIHLPCAGAGFR